VGGIQGRGDARLVHEDPLFGLERAGFSTEWEQADDEREAQAEQAGDLAQGTFLLFYGSRGSLAKIGQIGTHGNTLRKV